MNNLDLKGIAEDLVNTFLMAGKIAKEISQKGVEIVIKPDKSPVTNGDLAVDKILQTKIKSFTPDIPIVSEETVDAVMRLITGEVREVKHEIQLMKEMKGEEPGVYVSKEYDLLLGLSELVKVRALDVRHIMSYRE